MTQERAACTIIAKNYISFARTLAESFLEVHPDYKFYVLIVDEFAGYIDSGNECFEIVELSDLHIPNLPSLCFKYDIKELCTAVKADLLSYLINENSISRLIYLDPDIMVTASFDKLYEKLGASDIILTPHLDKDYPADGLLPNDGHILRAGQFNLGFIGVNSSENAKAFLAWWRTKLHENCFVDLLNGYFVDQKFIDFVPIFFSNVTIERDTGYNVAYWNLHSRALSRQSGSWKCNDGPLYFFHFSGYAPESTAISSHIPTSLARYTLSNSRHLKELFADYSERLLKNGYRDSINWPYTFDSFDSDERITNELRRHYGRLVKTGSAPVDPFSSNELRQLSAKNGNAEHPTAESQLNAILNSRAWRWVCRYGRLKKRLLGTK
jgi:hypothetical protein